MDDDERWAVIPDYPNYQVSDHGRVWSNNKRKQGVLKENDINGGYKQITLYKDNTKKQALVHRLVAFAFVGPCPADGYSVDHIDRNPRNNHYSNLRWATKSEQQINKNNRGKYHKNILERTKPNGAQFWFVNIRHPNLPRRYNKAFSKTNYTYEQVLAHRNEVYVSLGIEPVD